MKRLSDMFGEFDNSKVKRRVDEARALAAWDEIVGAHIAGNTETLYIKNNILYVRTKSPAWTQELKGLSHSICERINQASGFSIISDIIFVSGPLTRRGEAVDDENVTGPTTLSPSDLENIEATAELIQQDELKESFMRLMKKDRAHTKRAPKSE